MIPEAKAAYDRCVEHQLRPMLIETTCEALPWVVFKFPSIRDLSEYTKQASVVGPLQASIGLFASMVQGLPAGATTESILSTKPMVVMRAVQAVLRDLGLDARAEKKSP